MLGFAAQQTQERKPESRNIGPRASRRLDALAYLLSADDREHVLTIGRVEWRLKEAHDSLRAVAEIEGRLGEAAAAARREIDVLFSEPGGLLASTLMQYPANSHHIGTAAAQRFLERASRLQDLCGMLIEASLAVQVTRERAVVLHERFGLVLPNACSQIGLGEIIGSIRNSTSPTTARSIARTVDGAAELLEEHHIRLTAEAERYREVLGELGVQDGSGDLSDLESFVVSLRETVAREAEARAKQNLSRTCAAADDHITHLTVGDASAEFARIRVNPLAKSGRSKRSEPIVLSTAALLRWETLAMLQVQTDASAPTGQETSRGIAKKKKFAKPKSAPVELHRDQTDSQTPLDLT